MYKQQLAAERSEYGESTANQFAALAQNGLAWDVSPPDHVVHDINALNAGSEGVVQPIVYDRLIFANKRSRLQAQGDPIRGDIPIVPIHDSWFRVSVSPNIDLREGAMNVIAGADNSTANELRALRSEYSGTANLSAAQKDISLVNGPSDIIITAFP